MTTEANRTNAEKVPKYILGVCGRIAGDSEWFRRARN
jgi:hypothetical protein